MEGIAMRLRALNQVSKGQESAESEIFLVKKFLFDGKISSLKICWTSWTLVDIPVNLVDIDVDTFSFLDISRVSAYYLTRTELHR